MPDTAATANADALFAAIDAFIARRFAAVEKKLAELVTKVEAMPTAETQADIVARATMAAVTSIPRPADGKSVTPEDLRPMIEDIVARGLAALPRPADGASVTIEEVRPVLDALVAAKVAAIPPAKDGASIAELRPVIDAEVARAVGALPPGPDLGTIHENYLENLRQGIDQIPSIVERVVLAQPKPADGKSVTVAELRPVIAEMLALVPPPKDGVTLDEVLPSIRAEVKAAVAALPPPKNGTSVTLDDVRPVIDAELAAKFATLRVPQDGKSVDPSEVDRMVAARVDDRLAAALAALPPPKNGESVHPDTVRLMVEDATAAAIAKALPLIPRPENGKDADPAEVAALVNAEVARQFEILRPHIKGERGEDGLGFDDVKIGEVDANGVLTIAFVRGDRVREFKVAGIPHEAGVYVKGKRYGKSAIVTYGGSAFIAQRETEAEIGTRPPSPDWRLLVQRGRDA